MDVCSEKSEDEWETMFFFMFDPEVCNILQTTTQDRICSIETERVGLLEEECGGEEGLQEVVTSL